MDNVTIGDDVQPVYEFEWDSGLTRTTDELGDFEEAGFEFGLDEIVDLGRDDPDCTVRVIGFGAA